MSPMNGSEPKAAPVDVRCEGATDRQSVGPGLLLDDSPRILLAGERPEQMMHQGHPVGAGLDRHEATIRIDLDDAVQERHVDERDTAPELLARPWRDGRRRSSGLFPFSAAA